MSDAAPMHLTGDAEADVLRLVAKGRRTGSLSMDEVVDLL